MTADALESRVALFDAPPTARLERPWDQRSYAVSLRT